MWLGRELPIPCDGVASVRREDSVDGRDGRDGGFLFEHLLQIVRERGVQLESCEIWTAAFGESTEHTGF